MIALIAKKRLLIPIALLLSRSSIYETITTCQTPGLEREGETQIGKNYLLPELFGREISHVLRLNFLESPELADAFEGSLAPADILVINQ